MDGLVEQLSALVSRTRLKTPRQLPPPRGGGGGLQLLGPKLLNLRGAHTPRQLPPLCLGCRSASLLKAPRRVMGLGDPPMMSCRPLSTCRTTWSGVAYTLRTSIQRHDKHSLRDLLWDRREVTSGVH